MIVCGGCSYSDMSAIGETLRRERLRRNLDLQQISRELKISLQLLEAIEAEDFGKLPGAIFAKSFVRQYARLLGLDDEEMASEVARLIDPPLEAAPFPEKTLPSVPGVEPGAVNSWERVSDARRGGPSWLMLGTALVVITLACAGLYTLWQRTRQPARVTQAPLTQTAPVPAPEQPAAAPPSPAEQALPQPQIPADQPANAPDAAPLGQVAAAPKASQPPQSAPPSQAAESKPVSPPAVSTPAPNPVTTPPANPNASIHAQLTAQEPVWVRVRSNGRYLFSGTLAASQTRTVDADGDVEVLVGNAAGLDIQLNGKPLGALGPKGQVRTIQLTSGGFKIVPPSKPAPVAPFSPL